MTKNKNIFKLINKKNVCWDFEGVINEKVEVKSLGFEKGEEKRRKVRVNRDKTILVVYLYM